MRPTTRDGLVSGVVLGLVVAFDGLVLGFWPSLYGHEGAAQAMVATLLLWAFAWIVAAAMLATSKRAAAAS